MTKRTKGTHIADSASGGKGESMAREIREWLEWKMNHATKRMTEVNSFGRHHIPLDSQLNGYLQGERDCAIDALKQLDRISDAPARSSEARPGVGTAVESNTADEKQ